MTREEIAAALAKLGECYECGDASEVQMHHVVPKSKGGTMMVPLCLACHGVVHSRERMAISTLTAAALQHKKARGERVGAVPYGYAVAADGVMLVEDETEQEVIAVARELTAGGMSRRAVAEELSVLGYAPRSGGRWYAQQIQRMVSTMTAPRTTPQPTPRATTSGG